MLFVSEIAFSKVTKSWLPARKCYIPKRSKNNSTNDKFKVQSVPNSVSDFQSFQYKSNSLKGREHYFVSSKGKVITCLSNVYHTYTHTHTEKSLKIQKINLESVNRK